MNFRTLNIVAVFLSMINSLFYLLAPVLSLEIMSRSTNQVGLLNTRMAGACALGIAVITWMSRNIKVPSFQNIICAGNMAMFAALVTVELHGIWSGAFNWIGWLFVVADSSLGTAYAILFVKTQGNKN